MEKFFEVCARAFIIKDDKILLCKRKGADYFFFPGGHIEFGEKAQDTLRREMQEEIGMSLEIGEFVGVNENYFSQNGDVHHEFNLVFSGTISDGEVISKEDHLVFEWKGLASIQAEKVYPEVLRQELTKWLEDKKIFWNSQF